MKSFLSFCVFLMLLSSCSDAKNNPEEEVRLSSMDSTTKVLEENREKLEEQTKKVEASLEKLDDEFDSTDNNN